MAKLILGGGLGGLSAGYYLTKKFPTQPITIIESANRTGGWIRSFRAKEGIIFEQGARTIRPRGEPGLNTLQLIEDLHLEDQLYPVLSTSPAASNRMIYAKGGLHSLPSSVKGLLQKQEPFSKPLYKFFLNDLRASKRSVEDESIYDFVNRRFGSEVADYLISPLVCGICAGNAKEISVNFLMKGLFEYEQQYGNIYKGLCKDLFKSKSKSGPASMLQKRVNKEKWNVYSFMNGLETLTDALEKEFRNNGGQIIMNMKCTQILVNGDKVTVCLEDGRKLTSNHLISSIPANNLGNLLPEEHSKLNNMLKFIKAADVGVVNLHYNKPLIHRPGFGFLVAPKENLPILGVIYDTCCFPRGDSTVLTVMMGGYWFEHYFGSKPTEESLLNIALEQLKNILGIEEKPQQYKVNILREAIAQYTVGHSKNLQNILAYIKDNGLPLSLCGASYFGVGVNDVILSSKRLLDDIEEIKFWTI